MPREAGEWRLYILSCTCTNGRTTIHVGISKNVNRRLEQHRSGKVKATAGRTIVRLAHSGTMSKSEALRLEIRTKRLSPEKKRLVAGRWNETISQDTNPT